MAATSPPITKTSPRAQEASKELASGWRRWGRAATIVAILTAPVAFVWLHSYQHFSTGWAIVTTILLVAAFRGFVDVAVRHFIPWPSLFGVDDKTLKEDDVVSRRRAWFWLRILKIVLFFLIVFTIVWVIRNVIGQGVTWPEAAGLVIHRITNLVASPAARQYLVVLVIFMLINVLILVGPLMAMGIGQIRGYEPGDADWGVKLDDIRGQAEAKEEVRRIVTLWQSGEAFEKAGGKRERGVLFHGQPGTGKTMLAKGIATSFNSPIVTIPGSGFAQTFIGVDALIVRFLARKAKRLASKWGGQCIVFIDEIDAVGMRRSSLGTGLRPLESYTPPARDDYYGPWGAVTPTGDVIVETPEWREWLFAQRASSTPENVPFLGRLGLRVNQMIPGMFGGQGQLALQQLLVVMDGIDNPPFLRRLWRNMLNTFLDVIYIVPQRVGDTRLRVPKARPTGNQIYFIGATNVPLEALDPALIRPGRMGRHVWFRTPRKEDRKDIFDLYLSKVDHEPELDTDEARDELARMTNGYSPAMIDQVCSMALTIAQHDFRARFSRQDIVEAMTTVESGAAVAFEYVPSELKAIAIHEAGHAATSHLYREEYEPTRLTVKMRSDGSGGHFASAEREDRFVHFRNEEIAYIVMVLGAMAAEQVFYNENSSGVGGDVAMVTSKVARMVGGAAMSPMPIELPSADVARTTDEDDFAREMILARFEKIGKQIMNRSFAMEALSDPDKRRTAAQILGQAFVIAYNAIRTNRAGVEHIADVLVEKRELYGDEVARLLHDANLKKPDIDLLDEESWPKMT